MLSFKVNVDENVTLKTDALRKAYERGAHLKVIGKSAAEVVKENFRKLDSQRHRGGSFHFYGRARQSTHHGVQGGSAFVAIDQEGIALRRFGGTVRPRTGKYLTIPAIDAAQGKRAREFHDLHFRKNRNDGGRLCDPTGRVFYWLVKQSTHQPDTDVLPSDADITKAVTADLAEWTDLVTERG